MKEIKDLLSKNIQRAGIARQVEATLVLAKFEEILKDIFGSKILNSAKAVSLKDRVITVACLSEAVSQELKIKEREMIRNINEQFNKKIVERLRFLT
ncbi:MAG: DciA family protein [bacterium]